MRQVSDRQETCRGRVLETAMIFLFDAENCLFLALMCSVHEPRIANRDRCKVKRWISRVRADLAWRAYPLSTLLPVVSVDNELQM